MYIYIYMVSYVDNCLIYLGIFDLFIDFPIFEHSDLFQNGIWSLVFIPPHPQRGMVLVLEIGCPKNLMNLLVQNIIFNSIE